MPAEFSGPGQRDWTFLWGHPSDDCSIISRVKRRSQRRSGVLWKVQESQVSPLECLPSAIVAALLAPPQLSFCTRNAQCNLPLVLLNVCVHNMLWAVVCPSAACMGACAHTMLSTCAPPPCLICTNLDKY